MGKYKLVAFDMDGTLLNSQKQISEKTLETLKKTVKEGKDIALSTGRGLAELSEYMDILSDVHYLDCSSGALVYDRLEKKVIAQSAISVSDMKKLLEIATKEDIMLHILSERSIVQRSHFENMEAYQMGIYKPMFDLVADKCEDMISYYFADPKPVEKFNMYHRTPESRARTEERVKKAGLSVDMEYAETTSLECNAVGVNKGSGLLKLCEYLGITAEEAIAVGDSDNDVTILNVAGLAVAMGNADEKIKNLADVIVADCDHDGCAEVIEKYLLDDSRHDEKCEE
ncbi:MAG: Cof-type HAD-IIB family hydrolase [Clostridiales bacterium]|nr:Cof-type HAD-IIB family hydrolase [Clostridiales bacterium]